MRDIVVALSSCCFVLTHFLAVIYLNKQGHRGGFGEPRQWGESFSPFGVCSFQLPLDFLVFPLFLNPSQAAFYDVDNNGLLDIWLFGINTQLLCTSDKLRQSSFLLHLSTVCLN